MSGISGMTTYSSGDVSFVGGSTPEAQQFASNICTKLGACQTANHQASVSQTTTGRGR